MSKNAMIPSAAALLAALVAAAPMAGAGDMTPDNLAATRTPAQVAGGGYGHLSIPTTHQKGYFIAILQDSEGIDRYSVEAEMTLYLPATVGPPVFQIGGVYGVLRPLPAPGMHYILPLPPIGYVEGNWSLQPNNLGEFKLQAYLRRHEADKAELGGYLHGNFQVVDDGFIHPPLGPPSPGAKSNIGASQAPLVADFSWSGGVGGTGFNPPTVDGSGADVKPLRPRYVDLDEQPARSPGNGGAPHASKPFTDIDGSGADVQPVRPLRDIGAAGLSSVATLDGSTADVQRQRPSRDIGGQAYSGVATLNGSAMDVQRRRPPSDIGAGEAPNVMAIHASNADITQRRPAREIGAQGSLQGVLQTLDGDNVDAQRRRPASDFAAQAALGVADFDDLPGNEPALQKGRLRVRYVLFR